MSKLFEQTEIKGLGLQNRIAMAPMTRARTSQPGNIPNDMMATYYQQRATAGLIISEATQISDDSQGYSFTPGVYTDEQVAGWSKVTQAVHSEGSKMFCQLWHVGRVSHPTFQNGEKPMAPLCSSTSRNSSLDCRRKRQWQHDRLCRATRNDQRRHSACG